MTRIASPTAVSAAPVDRRTDLLKVKVKENDPSFKASATAFGFRLSGQANNRGTKPSVLSLEFDGKNVSVRLSRNDTAPTVLKKLQAALPKGYDARVLQSFRNMPPELVIGIAKKPAAEPKGLKLKVVENDPTLDVSQPAPNQVLVGGTASNNGIVASFMKVAVDGESVSLQLGRGATANTVVSKLRQALPPGYEVQVLRSSRNMPPEVLFQVVKRGAADA